MKDKTQRDTVFIVHPLLVRAAHLSKSVYQPAAEEQVEEAIGLVKAIDLELLGTRTVRLSRINPATLIGPGIIEEVSAACEETLPTLIFVNHTLSPVQQRNLEEAWNTKVIDRTGLILEIFGARAQTKEGQLQVELAALEYQKSRLVRSWTHLERQRGGAGFMGGPGETQIELDRRIISDKIVRIKKDLEHVRRTREIQRRGRERIPLPVVALVGYTNAGKSTLFNKLTGARVFARDLLFATLDPTMRSVMLANKQEVVLSDTVGFISDLPTHLVAAFRATLEQVQMADVILHVRDISRPDTKAQCEDVIQILHDLGIEYESDHRIIEVLNKIDRMDIDSRRDLLNKATFQPRQIAISALTGEGTENLLSEIQKMVSQHRRQLTFHIASSRGDAISWLHERASVLDERASDDGIMYLRVEIDPADVGRLQERFGIKPEEGKRLDAANS
ncbi:MAG: GTPase HflX [Micavibrio aeruginosavorus]|uniref:GTPase HflX n=1 Tax=Micavibrio aeruginosavorus TaxID=349221 RepID=A0A7T5R0U7_9BACT|nr:MAG: GTPase HflX [Micavibrio aeruginosavorus]